MQGSWDHLVVITVAARSQKTELKRNGLERPVKEGDNPVRGQALSPKWHPSTAGALSPKWHPSTAGHEKPCGNSGGPPPKAKYYLVTDSGLVP